MQFNSNFDGQVLSEQGFVVEFSNRGNKLHVDPGRYRNPEKKQVQCAVCECSKNTTSRYGVCGEHRKQEKHKWMIHKKDWLARIIPPGSSREQFLTNAPSFYDLTDILIKWAKSDVKKQERLDGFFFDIIDKIPGEIPDSTSLQDALEKKETGIIKPEEIILQIQETVDKHFPPMQFKGVFVENFKIKINHKRIPLRIIAALLQLAYICEEANRGDRWYKTRIGKPEDSRRAGCFMSAGHYLYRRYTKATSNQARMSLRG